MFTILNILLLLLFLFFLPIPLLPPSHFPFPLLLSSLPYFIFSFLFTWWLSLPLFPWMMSLKSRTSFIRFLSQFLTTGWSCRWCRVESTCWGGDWMQEAMLSRNCGVSLGSDCCRSPCTGMHYSQLIISSCRHHQSLTANNSSLQLSPSVIFLFLKRKRRRKRKVFGMAEEKSLPWPFQQYKRQGSHQFRLPLCLAKRAVESEWCFPQKDSECFFLGYTVGLGLKYHRKLWDRATRTHRNRDLVSVPKKLNFGYRSCHTQKLWSMATLF